MPATSEPYASFRPRTNSRATCLFDSTTSGLRVRKSHARAKMLTRSCLPDSRTLLPSPSPRRVSGARSRTPRNAVRDCGISATARSGPGEGVVVGMRGNLSRRPVRELLQARAPELRVRDRRLQQVLQSRLVQVQGGLAELHVD